MSEAHFDLVILHHSSLQPIEALVRDLLAVLDKQGDPYLEYKLSEALLFEENRSAILENLTAEEGGYYQQRFREFQIETELRPTLQLVAKESESPGDEGEAKTYLCPACGNEQPKSKGDMDACQRCGVVGEKYLQNQKREEVFLKEKRKLEDGQSLLMKEALDKARYDEDERLRQEARERLGFKKKRPLDWVVGGTVVILMGVAGFFLNETLTSTPEPAVDASGAAGNKGDANPADPVVADQAGTGSGADGKTVKIKIQPPAGGNLVVSGISDPMDRPVVESSYLLPGEGSAPVANVTAQAGQAALAAADGNAAANGVQVAAAEPLSTPASARAQVKQQTLTASELEDLKTSLLPMMPEQFFEKTTPDLYAEGQKRLERLLSLNKPDLAVVFADEMEDHYAASLLMLKVVEYELKQNSTKNQGDIIRGIKGRMVKAGAAVQALTGSSLSQAYAMQGDKVQGSIVLQKAVRDLREVVPTVLSEQQKLGIVLRMMLDQRTYKHTGQADVLMQQAEQIIATLPSSDLFARSQAYTQLASASIAVDEFDRAGQWLELVPDAVARKQLLSYLRTIETHR